MAFRSLHLLRAVSGIINCGHIAVKNSNVRSCVKDEVGVACGGRVFRPSGTTVVFGSVIGNAKEM